MWGGKSFRRSHGCCRGVGKGGERGLWGGWGSELALGVWFLWSLTTSNVLVGWRGAVGVVVDLNFPMDNAGGGRRPFQGLVGTWVVGDVTSWGVGEGNGWLVVVGCLAGLAGGGGGWDGRRSEFSHRPSEVERATGHSRGQSVLGSWGGGVGGWGLGGVVGWLLGWLPGWPGWWVGGAPPTTAGNGRRLADLVGVLGHGGLGGVAGCLLGCLAGCLAAWLVGGWVGGASMRIF